METKLNALFYPFARGKSIYLSVHLLIHSFFLNQFPSKFILNQISSSRSKPWTQEYQQQVKSKPGFVLTINKQNSPSKCDATELFKIKTALYFKKPIRNQVKIHQLLKKVRQRIVVRMTELHDKDVGLFLSHANQIKTNRETDTERERMGEGNEWKRC